MNQKDSIIIEIDENALLNFNFESIITIEELLSYFYDEKIKLKKNNYISFYKIIKYYQINNSVDNLFKQNSNYLDILEQLFKLQFITVLIDLIYFREQKIIKEKHSMTIKNFLILSHQNFLILSFILVQILQYYNMTNLYHKKISKIIYEKIIDKKLYQFNKILNIKDLFSNIKKQNEDIDNKIKMIVKENNDINNKLFKEFYNNMDKISSDKTIKYCLKILGLNDNDINDIDKKNYLLNNNIIKSVKVPFLPPIKNNENFILTIVLDLDRTLIYSELEESEEEEEECDEEEEEKNKQNPDNENIILRPGLYQFLENLMNLKCELIIFTSSAKQRADIIIDKIEKNKKYFNQRLYREHCSLMGAAYVKDISKLGRDLSKTIIIDNDLGCFYLQQENGILIKTFSGEQTDKYLMNLYAILNKIIKSSFLDIREKLDKFRDELLSKVAN